MINIKKKISAHSPSFLSLHLHHSSFSNPSIALPTSQLILQPFFCFSYVTGSSLTSPGKPPMTCWPQISNLKMLYLLYNPLKFCNILCTHSVLQRKCLVLECTPRKTRTWVNRVQWDHLEQILCRVMIVCWELMAEQASEWGPRCHGDSSTSLVW